jgi:hypothetical protein
MVTFEITSKTENWYRHLQTFEVVIPYVDSVSAIYVFSVYVLPNNFLTILFKGRCRRGELPCGSTPWTAPSST